MTFYFLTSYHAENICDPAGYRTKQALKKLERKTGEQTGNAEQHAEVLNQMIRKSVQKARGFEANRDFDEYIPADIIVDKQLAWPYAQTECSVFFFQSTDIFENDPHPERTIQIVGQFFAALTRASHLECSTSGQRCRMRNRFVWTVRRDSTRV